MEQTMNYISGIDIYYTNSTDSDNVTIMILLFYKNTKGKNVGEVEINYKKERGYSFETGHISYDTEHKYLKSLASVFREMQNYHMETPTHDQILGTNTIYLNNISNGSIDVLPENVQMEIKKVVSKICN